MGATTSFGREASRFEPITLPFDPRSVLNTVDRPARPELYRQAGEAISAGVLARRPYDDFLQQGKLSADALPAVPLVEVLVEATTAEPTPIFANRPEELINYERNQPVLEGLGLLGEVTMKQAGILARSPAPADRRRALELYEAALALGVQLYRERLIHRELEWGYRLIGQSLGGLAALARLEGDAGRAAELAEVHQAFLAYVNGAIAPVWEKIGAIDSPRRNDDLADIHAGDVAAVAQSGKADPMWRTEAILRLGRYRVESTDPQRRGGARKVLDSLEGRLQDRRHVLALEAATGLREQDLLNAR